MMSKGNSNYYTKKLDLSKDNIIVAFSSVHKYIAKDSEFPWDKLSADFKFLKLLIGSPEDSILVMGRKTAEIAKYSKYQKIIFSKSENNRITGKDNKNIIYVKSMAEYNNYLSSLESGINNGKYKIILGGESIYRMFLEKNDFKVFCTIIEEDRERQMEGNVYFPITFEESTLESGEEEDNKMLKKLNFSKFKDITEEVLGEIEKNTKEKNWKFSGGFVIENGYRFKFYEYSGK